jgi:hypothetical protein
VADGQWLGEQLTREWAGEIRDGRLPGGRRFFATVEPMHGVKSAVYTQPDTAGQAWARSAVLDDKLIDGHAIAVADYLGVGSDRIRLSSAGGRCTREAGRASSCLRRRITLE